MNSPRVIGHHIPSGLCVFALLLLSAISVRAQGFPGSSNSPLPVFTSPIDVTGATLRIAINAPHPDTQQRVDMLPPPALLPAELNELLENPINVVFDRRWNSPDSKTGVIPRQAMCDGTPERRQARQERHQAAGRRAGCQDRLVL